MAEGKIEVGGNLRTRPGTVRPATIISFRNALHIEGNNDLRRNRRPPRTLSMRPDLGVTMNGVIYLVGLVVVILAILSFFGLR